MPRYSPTAPRPLGCVEAALAFRETAEGNNKLLHVSYKHIIYPYIATPTLYQSFPYGAGLLTPVSLLMLASANVAAKHEQSIKLMHALRARHEEYVNNVSVTYSKRYVFRCGRSRRCRCRRRGLAGRQRRRRCSRRCSLRTMEQL